MRFLKIKCLGSFNSYRQPDFHTYHKTLPLPPKTTIAGLIGSALGISPFEINEQWLIGGRFKMGIIGSNNGQANDLWQIRKYESKQIKAYHSGKEEAPYKTAVIVRELLYGSRITLYLTFDDIKDFQIIESALKCPKWALSLGREDELIKIESIEDVELSIETEPHMLEKTVVLGDLEELKYKPILESMSGNLLKVAPKTVQLPTSFVMQPNSEVRQGNEYRKFTYIGSLPIMVDGEAYWDHEDEVHFQIF